MKKFKRFLISQMDLCKAQGHGGSVWVKVIELTEEPATIYKLYIGKKVVAGVRVEPNLRCVEVPDLNIYEQRHPHFLSPDAREIISEIESYVV